MIYYEFYFYEVYFDLDVLENKVKVEYVVYDFFLEVIKKRIDVLLVLLKEIKDKVINIDVLKF